VIWIASFAVGGGVGVVYFSALWLTVRAIGAHPRLAGILVLSSLGRMLLVGAAFALLSQRGVGVSLAALAGLLLARTLLLRRLMEARSGT